jgi:hypothetical protein
MPFAGRKMEYIGRSRHMFFTADREKYPAAFDEVICSLGYACVTTLGANLNRQTITFCPTIIWRSIPLATISAATSVQLVKREDKRFVVESFISIFAPDAFLLSHTFKLAGQTNVFGR